MIAAAATPGVQLDVPVLGYVFDPTAQTIRQATGVPGAASLDAAVSGSLKAAWVHGSTRSAIAVTKDGEIALVSWGGQPRTTILATGLSGLKAASFSASGNAAVLHDGASVEVWTNLISEPSKSATYADNIVAAAVRNDGAAAIAAASGTILLLTASGTRVIASGSDWKALAFAQGGVDLIAASNTEVIRLSGVDENPGQSVMATLDAPALAVNVSSDGSKVAVASANAIQVLGGARVACECEIKNLTALAGNLVVSLGGTYVFDADAAEPRIFGLQEVTGGAQ